MIQIQRLLALEAVSAVMSKAESHDVLGNESNPFLRSPIPEKQSLTTGTPNDRISRAETIKPPTTAGSAIVTHINRKVKTNSGLGDIDGILSEL